MHQGPLLFRKDNEVQLHHFWISIKNLLNKEILALTSNLHNKTIYLAHNDEILIKNMYLYSIRPIQFQIHNSLHFLDKALQNPTTL